MTSIRAEDAIDIKKSLNNKTNNVLEKYFVSSKKHLEEKSNQFINVERDKLKKQAFHNSFMLKAYQLKFPKIKFNDDCKPNLVERWINIPDCPPEKNYMRLRYKRIAHYVISNIKMDEYFEENWADY